MVRHRVRQGECLSSIAKHYGLVDWRTIYHHPQNAQFRQKRPDPNVIYPGDILFVPDKELKEESGGTHQRHRFKLRAGRTWLRIVVRDEKDQPLAARRYDLRVEHDRQEGTTGADGLIEHAIAADAEEGSLTIWIAEAPSEEFYTWILKIGHLDPASEITGVQARLNNLAFDCGEVDGINGPQTQAAIQSFQKKHGLTVDGIPGRQTQDKLMQAHGS